MSYTAIASRGENFNLNIFSHPPVKSQPQQHLNPQYTQLFSYTKPQTPVSAPFSDDEDIFDLDMVTMDMDFEQAYSMYSQLQQKNALVEVEQLQKAQQAHSWQKPQMNRAEMKRGRPILPTGVELQGSGISVTSTSGISSGHSSFSGTTGFGTTGFGTTGFSGSASGSASFSGPTSSGPTSSGHTSSDPTSYPDTSSDPTSYPDTSSDPTSFPITSFPLVSSQKSSAISQPQPRRLHQSVPDVFHYDFNFTAKDSVKSEFKSELGAETDLDDSVEDADQFFSNTESDALQKFLDNLAYSSQVNPLDFYAHESKTGHLNTVETRNLDAFKHHPVGYMQEQRVVGAGAGAGASLTPPDSASEEEPKKRRKTGKPLLSLEQKRRNHSHSEQKRRMLCKDAYERCLRLITNVDDYRNDLVSASSMALTKKKSKRRQLNKAGLPNLSKHCALMKISAEIEKIQKKNEILRSLAGMSR